MKERLIKFMEEESLTAAKFADEIGVQRSSISHILSGRNNPGYDFFLKVLKRYPHLNAEWLLIGAGKMTKTHQQASLFSMEKETSEETEQKESSGDKNAPVFAKKEEFSALDENLSRGNSENNKIVNFKSIEKIVILYSDQSFREYLPSK